MNVIEGVRIDPNTPADHTVDGYIKAADDAGMTASKRAFLRARMRVTREERRRHIVGRPMSPAEVTLWRSVLPATTSEEQLNRFDEGGFVPLPILNRIAAARKTRVFDRMEIWHVQADTDPMAVGIIEYPKPDGDCCFCLGRWGPHDANFLTLAELKEKATTQARVQSRNGLKVISGFTAFNILFFVVAVTWLLFARAGGMDGVVSWGGGITALLVVVWVAQLPTGGIYFWWREEVSKAQSLLAVVDQVPDEEDYTPVSA